MTISGRRVLAALATAALLTGCSGEVSVGSDPTVPQADLEQQVTDNISGDGSEDVDVACEGDLAAEVGATQDCLVTIPGAETSPGIRLTVDAVDGEDVDYSSLVFVTQDELTRLVQEEYVGQGISVDSVECDGELPGEVGATATCEVTSLVDGDATIEASTTSVDGLTVNFDLTVLDQG